MISIPPVDLERYTVQTDIAVVVELKTQTINVYRDLSLLKHITHTHAFISKHTNNM